MYITIGSTTKRYMNVMGIEEYPFTENELSVKFKVLVKKNHPDVGGSEEKMKKINEAHDALKNLAVCSPNDPVKNPADLDDGDLFKLYEVCIECNGVGSKKVKEFISCTKCDLSYSYWPTGKKTLKCFPCNGTGIFKLRNGREVECRKCNGIGQFTVTCKYCKGEGYTIVELQKECGKCKGLGKVEIKPFNPVIPKGAVL